MKREEIQLLGPSPYQDIPGVLADVHASVK